MKEELVTGYIVINPAEYNDLIDALPSTIRTHLPDELRVATHGEAMPDGTLQEVRGITIELIGPLKDLQNAKKSLEDTQFFGLSF